MKLIDILNEYKINQPNSNYKLVLGVVESYDDEDIMEDFLKEFPEGKNISKDQFFEFFGRYIDDMSEHYYIKQNWKYVESGGDDSVYDEEDDEEDEEDGEDGEDYLEEYTITKPDPKRPPSLIEVVKDRYHFIEDILVEGEYYTKEEINSAFFHQFVVGDTWELQKDKTENGEYYYKCIKGKHQPDYSDEMGWEYDNTTKDFFKILKR